MTNTMLSEDRCDVVILSSTVNKVPSKLTTAREIIRGSVALNVPQNNQYRCIKSAAIEVFLVTTAQILESC